MSDHIKWPETHEQACKRLEAQLARACDLLTQWLVGNGDKVHGQTAEFLRRIERRDNPPREEKKDSV